MPQRFALSVLRSRLKLFFLLGIVVSMLLLLRPVVTFAVGEDFPGIPEDGFVMVSRGPMEVVVSQVGHVESANNIFLINQCEWKADLIYLVPEGTWVEKGEIIAELDSSEIMERAKEREISVVNADANLRKAEEDLRIQELNNQSRIAAADLQSRLATLQLAGYVEAEYPQQLHDAERELALAEEEADRAEKKYEFLDGMVRLGYRTPADREGERMKLIRARQKRISAQGKLRLLTDFTYQRTLTELKSLREEADREMIRVEASARANMLSRKVNVQSRMRSYEIHRSYLERYRRSLAACTIRAPEAGEVVHVMTSSSSSRRLEEGDQVRYLQPIATIPDRNRMKVELRLHESLVRLVESGLPAVITVDAAAEQRFVGRVKEVSTVPMSGRFPNYDLKEYQVTVEVTSDREQVRHMAPGMSANVNIIAAQRQATLRLPIHCVAQVAGHRIAFVRSGDDVEPREVEVGLNNDETIEIVAGLDEGEEVVLKPRIACARRLVALENRYLAEQAGDVQWAWTAR